MFKIPIQELDEVVNDHFGSGVAQTYSTNDEAELQEQPRADDVDEEERDDPPDWEKMKVGLYFLPIADMLTSFIEHRRKEKKQN